MPTMKKGLPKLSPFAQMLRDKREKLAPNATLREFCAARGLEASMVDGMEHDRRTAPGTYGALYKLAGGYGHGPTDRWTVQLLDAALGKEVPTPSRARSSQRSGVPAARLRTGSAGTPKAASPRSVRKPARSARGG